MAERYAYEQAQKRIEAFLSRFASEFAPGVWRRFLLTLLAEAVADGSAPDAESALAFGWELGELAFRGHGTPALQGLVEELWVEVPEERRELFRRTLQHAFAAADRATPVSVARLVPAEIRAHGIWNPLERPRCRVLIDPDHARVLSDAFTALDAEGRVQFARRYLGSHERAEDEPPTPPSGPRLRLV